MTLVGAFSSAAYLARFEGETMSDDKSRIEEHARSENEWVRARILKQDPPAEGSLLKIAGRARDMAASSLGKQHSAYGVALQNLGLYYDAIENDTLKADEFFAQARAVLKRMISRSRMGSIGSASSIRTSATMRNERRVGSRKRWQSSAGNSARTIRSSPRR